MKHLSTLAVLLAGNTICACTGSSSSPADNDPTVSTDTVITVSETEEPTQPDLLVTPDLTLLEVKGNVRTINDNHGNNAKFDESGTLTHYGNSDPIDKLSHIKRDKDGRLTDFLASEWMTVTWDSQRPLTIKNHINECEDTGTYKYDSSGLVTEITYVSQCGDEDPETWTVAITYPADAFDSNGNWVKRTVKLPTGIDTQTRKITYY